LTHAAQAPDTHLSGVPRLSRNLIGSAHRGHHVARIRGDVRAAAFPITAQLEVFTRWTSAHGKYRVTLRLQDLTGNMVSQMVLPPESDIPNPLQAFDLILGHCHLEFPEPGKYDLVMLANDEEITRDAFYAYLLREKLERHDP
jgi:hypothetical protein